MKVGRDERIQVKIVMFISTGCQNGQKLCIWHYLKITANIYNTVPIKHWYP